MGNDTPTQAEIEILFGEHEVFISRLRARWLAQNRSRSRDVYEVMNTRDRQEVHDIIERWVRYVTPLAEAWWRERGYEVVWPSDDSEPMQVFKLETKSS